MQIADVQSINYDDALQWMLDYTDEIDEDPPFVWTALFGLTSFEPFVDAYRQGGGSCRLLWLLRKVLPRGLMNGQQILERLSSTLAWSLTRMDSAGKHTLHPFVVGTYRVRSFVLEHFQGCVPRAHFWLARIYAILVGMYMYSQV